MGQAFHRKCISIERSQTRGTGIRYVDVVFRVHEPTAEQVAAREEEAQQRATREEHRRRQQSGIDILVEVARKILHEWKQAVDHNDQRLSVFAGWTTSDYCALPVDEDAARFYAETIQQWQRRVDRPISLDELDRIFGEGLERSVSTERVVEKAIQIIRPVAQTCANADGIALARVAELLSKRSSRARQLNIDLDSALAFVSKHMALMDQELEEIPASNL